MKANFIDHLWLFEAKQQILTKWEEEKITAANLRLYDPIGSSFNDIIFAKEKDGRSGSIKKESSPHRSI